MKKRESADSERIVQTVVERIKVDHPHADPILVAALIARLRKELANGRERRINGEGA